MRVLTFQSQAVLEILLKDGIYYADLAEARERHNYSLDIETLGGEVPIWCFVSLKGGFTTEHFMNGDLFERYRCEMSLNQDSGLSNFVLLELEIPDTDIHRGLTHNAYLGAKVTAVITKEYLCGVYSLTYPEHWYYAKVDLVLRFREDILFPETLQCKEN
jgi:hypothetical protein